MTTAEFKALFPMTVKVTEQMITEGRKDIWNNKKCIGAQMLKAIIANHPTLKVWGYRWEVYSGFVTFPDLEDIQIISFDMENQEDIFNMLNIFKPTTVYLNTHKPASQLGHLDG